MDDAADDAIRRADNEREEFGMDDQRDLAEERFNRDLQMTGDGEALVHRLIESEVWVENALDDHGFKLRVARLRGILHFGVEDNLGQTQWADVNTDDLMVALRMLGVVD